MEGNIAQRFRYTANKVNEEHEARMRDLITSKTAQMHLNLVGIASKKSEQGKYSVVLYWRDICQQAYVPEEGCCFLLFNAVVKALESDGFEITVPDTDHALHLDSLEDYGIVSSKVKLIIAW